MSNTRASAMQFVALCLCAIAAAGCTMQDSGAYVVPGTTIPESAAFVVLVDETDKGEAYWYLQRSLIDRGRDVRLVEPGAALGPLAPGDVIVRYGAIWRWDITWYLEELTVYLYTSDDESLLASGRSLRSSLTRNSAEAMAEEIIRQILEGETT